MIEMGVRAMHQQQVGIIFHKFAVGDLVLFDDVLAAFVLRLWHSAGIPMYDLQTEGGIIERNVVGGYLRPWPKDKVLPPFQTLRRL